MKNRILCATALVLGHLAGCASVEALPPLSTPHADMAMVNFVRLKSAVGDDVPVELWDGNRYIGSIAIGQLIQYEVEAGRHVFLGMSGNWAYAPGELEAGKQYFIKANIFPGFVKSKVSLGVAKADDKRIPLWLGQLKRSLPNSPSADSPNQAEARQALADFNAGKAPPHYSIHPEDGLAQLPEPQTGKSPPAAE